MMSKKVFFKYFVIFENTMCVCVWPLDHYNISCYLIFSEIKEKLFMFTLMMSPTTLQKKVD